MKQSDFSRIKHNINGNSRFVVHFLQCALKSGKATVRQACTPEQQSL
ncbi:hypothetical protein JWJ90_13180 [Desulfobulbus rhabdoformis]|nr:hypothetical protein [Desulfobulbus rhabdoformis]MBM9615233.1 hypothetical protein [Desulfobulbus rhabdoformis]